MGGRNYWHVYNWLRQYYLATGAAAERMDLLAEFAEQESGEIDEGIAEFELAIGKRKKGAVPDGKEHTQAD
ncbi:hypothetical protein [Paenibacillus donghaensis]|uniref:Uncharacterized protein n=1 Tax=Paenibacillus donghaensis TaxID=414771 RepID=A0A2Z2KS95_9BACL|nr:hypothetical protein [Paenibacillus donghaensis]ASA21988.1 hypothetical protein B9T62_15105 [Paenibacillus donghaensis]